MLGKGKFEVNKKNNEFTEYLSKKFLTKILGMDKAIDHIAVATAKEGLHVNIGVAGSGEWSNEALLLIEHYAKSRLGYIDKALKDGLITEAERAKYEKLQEVYKAWESYAKEKEQDVSDAIQEAFASVLETKQNFAVWKYDFNGDTLNALKKTAEYKQEGLALLKDSLGVDNINIDNYLDLYNEALKNSPTPEVIEKWNRLGDALIDATEAEEAYKNAVKQYNESVKNTIDNVEGYSFYNTDSTEALYKKIKDLENELGISGVTVENFAQKIGNLDITSAEAAQSVEELGNTLIQLSQQIAQDRQNYWLAREESDNAFEVLKEKLLRNQQDFSEKFIKETNKTYNTIIENTKKYISSLQRASDTLGGLIDKLTEDLVGYQYTEGLFYKTLDKAKEELFNKDYENYAQTVQDLSKYIKFLDQKQYASAYEARYEKAVILNELRTLKSPTDIMIEQLQQIVDNTQASLDYNSRTVSSLDSVQENIYKLVNEQLGGRNFEEIVANGIIQGVKTDNLAAVLGQSGQSLVTQLQNMNAKWDRFPIADGKMMVVADFDEDGVNDIAFGIDASGKIASIDTQTANLYKTIEKSFGGIDLKEVFVGDAIQSLYGDNWTIAIGDSLNIVNETLQALNSTVWSLGNNLVVDIDQNGTWDFVLTGDATGHLQAIQQNTGSTAAQIAQYISQVASEAGVELDTTTASQIASSTTSTLTASNFYSAVAEYQQLAANQREDDPDWWRQVYEAALTMQDSAQDLYASGYDMQTGLYGDAYDSISDVANSNIAQQIAELAKKHGVTLTGYALGGYTGDYPTHQIAGVVHGGEFVVNAKTTRILGLNKDNGGVFVKMLNELETMRKEIVELRKENEEMKIYMRQTSENTKPIAKNDIFSEVA